jgi:hypothetical protein
VNRALGCGGSCGGGGDSGQEGLRTVAGVPLPVPATATAATGIAAGRRPASHAVRGRDPPSRGSARARAGAGASTPGRRGRALLLLAGWLPLPPPSIAMHAHHSPLTSRGAMVSRTGKTLLRAPAAAGSSARTHLGMIDSDTNRAARGLFHRGIVSATI